MLTAQQVADFFLANRDDEDGLTHLKLQKLCYYAQAWSLVWDERPMFTARIEAWANGPVAPRLYAAHRGSFRLFHGATAGDSSALSKTERDTVASVLRHYGKRSSQWLSDLTHRERPWKEAREGLAPGERGEKEITHAAMAEYYGSL